MIDTIQLACLISILCNLLFLSLGIVFISKRGGLSYLQGKLSSLTGGKVVITPRDDIPYQCDRITHFQTLPSTNSEIIFLGDSLTDSCEWSELFANIEIKNRGISGDRTDGVLSRVDDILKSHPQKIFLMIGINDLVQGVTESQVVGNYRVILEKIKIQSPETQVFIQSVLPINNRKSQEKLKLRLDNEKVTSVNDNLKELAQEFSFYYIDLFSAFCDDGNALDSRYTTDGIHLNGKGYLLWQEIIKKDVVN
ncbi:MAG TPA: GDSL-type esterase/lipase family protein [Coleofasciculaceae cyanobacterium]